MIEILGQDFTNKSNITTAGRKYVMVLFEYNSHISHYILK